jgi:hypothetical protein
VRHLLSVVIAPVLGVVVYVLLAIALVRVSAPGDSWTVDHIVALAAALGAGAAYAVLILPRLSPIGPVLVGLAYLGLTIWAYSDVGGLRKLVPNSIFGGDFYSGVRPALPTTAVLAVPLLLTVVSARRWRRYEQRAAPPPPPAYPPPPPAYAPPPQPMGEPPMAGGYPYSQSGSTVPLTYADPISAPPYGDPPPPPPGYPVMNPDHTRRI